MSYMDKCGQDKCCLDKYHGDSWYLFLLFPGKFHQNWMSNSRDIANIEFPVGMVVDGGGVKSF